MKIVIIGAGVSGLTTGICVKEKYPDSQVIIIADKFGENTTSTIAGALWEWQPAVCGFYETIPDHINKRDNQWAMNSYRKFSQLKEQFNTGIYWRRVNFYLTGNTELEREKIKELSSEVMGFSDDQDFIFKRNSINKKLNNFVGAYSYLTPIIDTSVYLHWLMNTFLNMSYCSKSDPIIPNSNSFQGSGIIQDNLKTIESVQDKYSPDLIINCAGLENHSLVNDKNCIPVQGGWLLFDILDISDHIVQEAHCTTIQENKYGGNFIFIVPRGVDKLIVGGFAVANDWNTDLTLNNPLFERIIEQNSRLLPWLSEVKPINYRVGLRPFRKKGVRLELDYSYSVPVIHNYGHGGSGVTLSWGCADNASDLIS